jgi:ABC-type sugar transport system, periplasmic component
MKNKSFKRLLSFILAIVIVYTILLTGCGKQNGSNGSETSTTGTNTTASLATTEETKKEPGVVKIFSQDSPYIQRNYDQGLEVVKEIEKELNIKIEWELMPYSGYEDALKIKLAAKNDMPDIFSSWDQQNPEVLYKNGAIVALSDYFGTVMKQTKDVIDADPGIKAALTSPDGKVLFLSMISQPGGLGWMIRKDWLDKLKLKVPETTDDLYNVLKAFKEGDPNGNGKKDEIPLSLNYLNYSWMYFMESFGIQPVAPWDWVGKDSSGKIVTYVTQPQFKETMAFCSKLYKEKLLNQDILNITNDAYNQSIYDNKVGCTYNGISEDFEVKLKEAHPDVNPDWFVMLPPKGPTGDSGIYLFGGFNGQFYISKDGKNPTDAARFFNFIFADPKGRNLMCHGIEGYSYNMENGKVKYTSFVTDNPDKLSPSMALMSIGAKLTMPYRKDLTALDELAFSKYPWCLQGYNLYKENVKSEPEKKYRFTTEESTEIQDIKSKLDNYITETLAKMLIGNEPIDNFDKFASTLKEKGVERLAEIYTKVEERMK